MAKTARAIFFPMGFIRQLIAQGSYKRVNSLRTMRP
jgi:hypothetical protein